MSRNEDFLRDVVLKQPGAIDWIRKQLSIAWYIRFWGGLRGRGSEWRAPHIWVCTGIQLVENGEVSLENSAGRKFEGSVTVNPGMLTTAIPNTPAVVEVGGSNEHTTATSTNYGYTKERIWAAQFFRLDVDYLARGKGTNDDKAAQAITLIEIEDLGATAIRRDTTAENIAENAGKDDGGKGDEASKALDNNDSGARDATIVGLVGPDVYDRNSGVARPEELQKSNNKPNEIIIDDAVYSKALKGIDWNQHEKYSNWVDTDALYRE